MRRNGIPYTLLTAGELALQERKNQTNETGKRSPLLARKVQWIWTFSIVTII